MIKKGWALLIVMLMTLQISFAKEEAPVSTYKDFDALTIDLLDPSMKVSQISINFNVVISQIEAFNDFIRATDKFKQSNVGAAYDDAFVKKMAMVTQKMPEDIQNDVATLGLVIMCVDNELTSSEEKLLHKLLSKEESLVSRINKK